MRTKFVRGYMVPHSASKQNLVLVEDTFTIIMSKCKDMSVMIGTIIFIFTENFNDEEITE